MHAEKIRELLQYMESVNVLVGFFINWLLTTVEHPVSAARVVDLELSSAYQSYVRALNASLGEQFNDFFQGISAWNMIVGSWPS